jgi:signal peptidase I
MRPYKNQSIDEILAKNERMAARDHDWILLLVRFLITGLIMYLALGVIWGVSRVYGSSMEPTIKDGDITVFYRHGDYGVGDIVIISLIEEPDHLIKRVIAVAGDTVDIDEAAGSLLINGVAQSEPYTFCETHAREGGIEFPVTIPEGSVLLLGDNRMISKDSRELGLIKKDKIAGRVIITLRLS